MFMPDVNEVPLSEEPVGLEPAPVVESTPAVEPGSKTPPELLLKSLHEEREARKELEGRIALLESSSSPDVFSDEGKALQGEISTLKSSLDELKHENAKKDVLISYPVMKEKWEEFETFRADPENKGMNLKTATKAFLTEQGLFEPTRKGLEKTTGGPRVPVSQEISPDDIKALRENDFRKYSDMVSKGLIKV